MFAIFKNHLLTVCFVLAALFAQAAPKLYFYELRTFHLKTQEQEDRLDNYLRNAYLPALHRAGIEKVGVFKPLQNPEAERLVYVLVPFKKIDQYLKLEDKLAKDKAYAAAATDYTDAAHNNPPYTRFESALMEAFSGMPSFRVPTSLKSGPEERIYVLRNYEAATEKLHLAKIHQFNNGEMQIFERLGFNAVFYGRVRAGNKLPSLMYITAFENKAERDAHWKAFSADPEWKKLNSLPEYKNNFLRADIILMHPAGYSEI